MRPSRAFRLGVIGAAVSGCIADPMFVGTGGAGGSASTTATTGATSATSSSSSSASSSTVGSTSSAGGAGGAGGEGGGCALPPVAPCGDFKTDFSTPLAIPTEWIRHGAAGNFTLVNDALEIHMTATAATMYLETAGSFSFTDCAVWAAIVQAAQPVDIMTRISVGLPDMSTVYSLGVHNGLLLARSGDTVVAMTAYDPAASKFVRMRAEGTDLHFGSSPDASCWTEFHTLTMPMTQTFTGRLVLEHMMALPGSTGDALFDDYNVTP